MKENRHTYKFGMIGNCSFLSYIDLSANVVWQCWPNFDSDFVFGSLMDKKKGGEFSIRPDEETFESGQYYLENTNILATEFRCASGSFRVIDFAPRFEMYERWHKPLKLFRKIEVISGAPKVKVVCQPVADHGRVKATVKLGGSNHLTYDGLPFDLRLTTNIPKSYIAEEQSFVLTENKYLVLSYNSKMEFPLESTFEEFFLKTKNYWMTWVKRATIPNFYQEWIIRSALLLKLHQFEDTGAVIASGTTSLPEHPGNERNWDYRYCWIRDSYFTLNALNNLSHFEEMEAFSQFIQNISANSLENLQPVYSITGVSKLTESISELEGYLNNPPVRFGNEAYLQIQNDVYGQVILSLIPLILDKRINIEVDPLINICTRLLDVIEDKLDEPDAGIWEYRGKKQLHTGTLVFHWAGIKSVNKIAQSIGDKDLESRTAKLLDSAKDLIEKSFDPNTKGYTASEGSPHYNASELLLITMNYFGDNKERAQDHLIAIENSLKTDNDFIYRYRDIDDFGETHSSFMICGFWYAEALACVGRIDDAIRVFKNLLSTANHLGILSEDVDPKDSSQWGNFAQTYSHVGLINAAFRISSKLDKLVFE